MLTAGVDRSGAGPVVEVYPAASLKLWGLPHQGYKRQANTAALACLIDQLLAATSTRTRPVT